ncbi:uncharacterized protein PFL1_00667 [Pseudozyma flocculosa PF-1]|uniref:Peroxisome assembly protein 12 n=1 Tax=Pseudozyma flocculosa TaxID=84751 RepID=A0A5C3ETX7_9BASI|nr:uncharacterized protein PFL1_00667 [Pseudozyma flocculosa PF-1]EPQ32472.1 hypothetical protein PFL1_00667 [Pseudozyma flocculosa PF-1]SPO34539.1 related to Peroxisome assembly protein 12 [Pseudozyma flocculosa]
MDLLTSVDPTSSSSSDPYHPSFFELAASDQLRDLIKPAARYILAVLAQRNPRHLIRIVNHFDEVYHLVMLGVERHYLSTWGASFAENFYGLKRRRRPALQTTRAQSSSASTSVAIARAEALTRREVRLSLLFAVGLPYVQAKLHDFWERNGGGVDGLDGDDDGLFGDEGQPGGRSRLMEEAPASRRERLHRALLRLFKTSYPYAGALYQLWLLSYNVGYLFDKTPYWRPWFWLMRVDVRRMGGGDGPRRPVLPKRMPPLSQPLRLLSTLLRLSPRLVFESLKYALPLSIFFFKFLEWWYGADNPRRRRGRGSGSGSGAAGGDGDGSGSGPLFGPPSVLQPHPRGILTHWSDRKEAGKAWKHPKVATHLASSSSSEDGEEDAQQTPPPPYTPTATTTGEGGRKLIHNSCPLCGTTPIANPALLPSGYVFCYTCAHDYVERHARCPVTLVPIHEGVDGLRKVLG